MSRRAQKRLEAAEEVCRALRKGVIYYDTQEYYFGVAIEWLQVWIKHAPLKVWTADPIIPKKKKK